MQRPAKTQPSRMDPTFKCLLKKKKEEKVEKFSEGGKEKGGNSKRSILV